MDMLDLAGASKLEDPAAGWWRAWRIAGDGRARDSLIGHYQRHVRVLAAQLYGQHTFKVVEFDDYLQFAQVGMIEALDRYEPEGGARFETFSASRIRGAILDGVRRSSDVQEQISARRRIAGERIDALASGVRDSGTDDADTLFACLADVAIGLAIGFVLDGTGMVQSDEDAGADVAYRSVELAQMAQRVRALVRSLPHKPREVIAGHYLQQMSFGDIAERLQLSRSRVTQLHQEGLERLRAGLAGYGMGPLSC